MPADLAHRPEVLYAASIERREAAWAAFRRGDYVLTSYLSGLAVECILQAIALHDNPTHDARHDLTLWLARCRRSLRETVKRPPLYAQWSFLNRVWRNELRYLSSPGYLGHIRRLGEAKGIRGGPDAIMKAVARKTLDAATGIHGKGVLAWIRYKQS